MNARLLSTAQNAKRMVGDRREKLWQIYSPETRGVHIALTDLDHRAVQASDISLAVVTLTYGGIGRLGLPGGGAENPIIETARIVTAAARKYTPFEVPEILPEPTRKAFLRHRNKELRDETGTDSGLVHWSDVLDARGTVTGNRDATQIHFGHLGEKRPPMSSSSNEIGRVFWMPLPEAIDVSRADPEDSHYALRIAVGHLASQFGADI